jgi:hypothetical protein
MNGYFAAGRISEDEKNDILKLHTSVYNGYRTMQPEVKNEQPLYVYDPAQDKVGAVMSNKGVVKAYTNVGINESTEQKEVCDECGSMMMDGVSAGAGGWQLGVVGRRRACGGGVLSGWVFSVDGGLPKGINDKEKKI